MPKGIGYKSPFRMSTPSGGDQTGNKQFHKRATLKGSGAGPKSTAMGKDTSQSATNVIPGTKVSTKELSPSACNQTRNRNY